MNLTQLPRWLRDHYLATGLLMLSGLGQSLFAATLIVNSLEDTTLADGQCTLREALDNANQDTGGVGDCLAGSGDDVIDLTGLNGIITLSSELKITSNLVLEGPGAEKLTISGNHQTSVFYIGSYSSIINAIIEIDGIKIIDGYGTGSCNLAEGEDAGGNSSAGGINSYNNGTLTINNSTISNSDPGDGICNCGTSLILINSTVSRNKFGINNLECRINSSIYITNSVVSENGSGILNNHTLIITDSIVSENKYGGIENYDSSGRSFITNSTISGNGYSGIENDYGGILTITNSIISGNSAYNNGGGISNNDGDLTVTNSTISGNSAKYAGGGIYNNSTITITNSTISENISGDNPDDPNDGGGGIYSSYGTLNLKNTLIANNTNGDCYNNTEWGGTIDTNLNNFISDGSCNPTFSGDPQLGPLANNGGPTFTHALLRGSPAIDVGDDTICAAEPVNGLDQRGVPRFGSSAGNHCDIGAYEYQKPALATLGSFTIDSNAISWETLAEQGTQGFYLWQAEPVVAGTCEAVTNPQLVISKPISAKGSEVQGKAYQAAVAVNLNGCYGIQEIPSGQIYITPRPGRNEWTGEQWLTR